MPDVSAIRARLRDAGVDCEAGQVPVLGVVMRVGPTDVSKALTALRDAADYNMLIDLVGTDADGDVEITYHLRSLARGDDVYVRTKVGYEGRLPSVWQVFPSALYPEREAAELFGVTLQGHPNPKRLLTSEDSPANLLRKSTQIRTVEEVHDREF